MILYIHALTDWRIKWSSSGMIHKIMHWQLLQLCPAIIWWLTRCLVHIWEISHHDNCPKYIYSKCVARSIPPPTICAYVECARRQTRSALRNKSLQHHKPVISTFSKAGSKSTESYNKITKQESQQMFKYSKWCTPFDNIHKHSIPFSMKWICQCNLDIPWASK